MNAQVLIVGGGPTGMTLALQLKRFGIAFRLIEKRPKEPSGSKALSVNPASLTLLNDLGLANDLVAVGHKTDVINLLYHNQPLTRARFAKLPSKYPYFLMLPQPDTEAVLEQRLNDLDQHIERDCELLGLQPHSDHVEVELREGNQTRRQRFAYVVGCDGGLSKVRNELGVGFTGYDYNMHFILADLRIDWDGKQQQGFYFIRDDGFLILLPLKSGYHRIVIKVAEQCPPGYKPSLQEIRDYIARYEIPGLQVSEPIWLSSAPFYNRSASAIRQQRVFLAGDAAHMFSPIGGFGMNSGIADAFNLGWKLGYAMTGIGSDALLQSYAEEREQNTQALLAKTDKSTSLIARLDRHQPADEQHYLPLLRNRPFIRQFPLETAGLTLRYGPATKALASGCMLPYARNSAGFPDSLQAVGQAQHTLLLASDALPTASALQRLHRALTPLHARLRIQVLSAAEGEVAIGQLLPDPHQQLRSTWQLQNGDYLLVRPDLFIEHRGHLDDLDALSRHLAAHYTPDAAQQARLAG